MAKPKKQEELKSPGMTGYIFKPMLVTLRHVIKPNKPEDWWNRRPCTLLYPYEKDEMPETFRGLLSVSDKLCFGCGKCARVCPNDCLEMIDAERLEGGVMKKTRRPQAYIGRCMFCGLCEENCPAGAFVLSEEYELATSVKGEMVMTPADLNKAFPKRLLEKAMPAHPNIHPAVDADKCISCKLCAKNCPQNAIEMVDIPGTEKVLKDGKKGKPKSLPIFDYSQCVWCELCEENCRKEAIKFIETPEAEKVNAKNLAATKAGGGA